MSGSSSKSTRAPSSGGAETVGRLLERGTRALEEARGSDARREARYLLAGLLDVAPGVVPAVRGRRVDPGRCREFDRRIARRQAGEPLQYIEGRAAFRELMLRVDPSVLIPRPETEGLVGEVLDWARGRGGLRGLDLGTGSGAIAISLALEGPFERIVGVDISDPALKVAWSNVIETGVGDRVELRSGSLFEALDPDERFDVIVSNPPYIADHEADELPIEVRDWEPSVALYAGPTGSEVIDRIVDGAATHLKPGGLLALEVADGEAASVTARLREGEDYVNARSARDLAGRRRVVMAERR